MSLHIEQYVQRKDWLSLVTQGFPVNVTDTYTYEEAMRIVAELDVEARRLLMGSEPPRMQDFAITMMYILRAIYPEKWQEDWQNEAFLGISCGMNYREDEAFQCLHTLYQSMKDPPAALILACICFGTYPPFRLSSQRVAELSQEAVEKELTVETAERMAALTDDPTWKTKAEEAKKANIHTECIIPKVMQSVFNHSQMK